MHAEIEQAIEDIANDSVVYDTSDVGKEINMDDVDLSVLQSKIKSRVSLIMF